MSKYDPTMSEQESQAFDAWFQGITSDDTDPEFNFKRKAGEEAVWWAVGHFGISYADCTRSWIQAAAILIQEGMDN